MDFNLMESDYLMPNYLINLLRYAFIITVFMLVRVSWLMLKIKKEKKQIQLVFKGSNYDQSKKNDFFLKLKTFAVLLDKKNELLIYTKFESLKIAFNNHLKSVYFKNLVPLGLLFIGCSFFSFQMALYSESVAYAGDFKVFDIFSTTSFLNYSILFISVNVVLFGISYFIMKNHKNWFYANLENYIKENIEE